MMCLGVVFFVFGFLQVCRALQIYGSMTVTGLGISWPVFLQVFLLTHSLSSASGTPVHACYTFSLCLICFLCSFFYFHPFRFRCVILDFSCWPIFRFTDLYSANTLLHPSFKYLISVSVFLVLISSFDLKKKSVLLWNCPCCHFCEHINNSWFKILIWWVRYLITFDSVYIVSLSLGVQSFGSWYGRKLRVYFGCHTWNGGFGQCIFSQRPFNHLTHFQRKVSSESREVNTQEV